MATQTRTPNTEQAAERTPDTEQSAERVPKAQQATERSTKDRAPKAQQATERSTKDAAPKAERATERLTEVNEQVLDFGRKAGFGAVEAVETTWSTVADYQDKVADSTKIDWIADAARAQANLTREVTRLYSSTARDLLKK